MGQSHATFSIDGKIATIFKFNHIIAHFGVPKQIVTDHGSHFQNTMMSELSTNLGFKKEHSSPYYTTQVKSRSGKKILENHVAKNSLQEPVKMAHYALFNIMGI